MALNEPLKNLPGAVNFVVAELKFDVRQPALLVRHAVHPPFENLPCSIDISQHLLHVNVLVPELIHARQQHDGSVPDVSCVVYEFVLHLQLRVLQPESVVPVIHLECAFPHTPGSVEVLLRLLPLGVLNPDTDVPPHAAADEILELLALAEAIVGEFGRISDFMLRQPDFGFLALACFAEDLFGTDLYRSRGFVFDLGRVWKL